MTIGDQVLHLRGANLVSPIDAKAKPNKTYPSGRICARPTCTTVLSIYNEDEWCWDHRVRQDLGPDPRLSQRAKEVHAGTYEWERYVRHGGYYARRQLMCECPTCLEANARAAIRERVLNPKHRRKREDT